MADTRRLKATWLVGPLVFAALTASSVASAGSLQVRDEPHVLGSDDIARLRADVARAPFDVRFVVTTAHADPQELARTLEPLVSQPDMIVVGLDPEHHHVQVRFGTGSHVPEASWGAIEKSGNDGFRHGHWEEGAAAIVHAATDAVSASPSGLANPDTRAVPSAAPSQAGPGMVFLVIGGFVALALVASFFFRRRGMPPMGGYGPQYGGGGYGYGPQPGGMGPVGGGLIGAGLGGLAGYEIGKLEGEREERDRDRGFGGDNPRSDEGGGNYDAGGGGSDWDAGGGGGGGFDGGGGDSGGGGSDF